MIRVIFLLGMSIFYLVSCQQSDHPTSIQAGFATTVFSDDAPKSKQDYWYQGKAEISRYELKQVRYGEVHEGEVVMIFVTEDFRTDKQVKLESPQAKQAAVSILKLNALKRFTTGIYDYSLMTSVFSPIDWDNYTPTLKVTHSLQDWCGQIYTQLNLKAEKYQVKGHSYFEQEADQSYNFPQTYLEDEVWTQIRINPDQLPTGEIKMVPELNYCRMWHHQPEPQEALATLQTQGKVQVYAVHYPKLKRTLSITFTTTVPHAIESWEVQHANGLTTTATKTDTILSDYWAKNGREDESLRGELGL